MKNVKVKLRLQDGTYIESAPIVVPTQGDLDKKQDLLPVGQDNQFLHKNPTTGAIEWVDAPIKTINYVEPDAEGNVDLQVVPAARMLVTDTTEIVSEEFQFRTTGGSGSIGSGDAYVKEVLGTSRPWSLDLDNALFTRGGTFGNNTVTEMSDIIGKKFRLKNAAKLAQIVENYHSFYSLGATFASAVETSEFIEVSEDGTTVLEFPLSGTVLSGTTTILNTSPESSIDTGLELNIYDGSDWYNVVLQYNAGWIRINSHANLSGITDASKAFWLLIFNNACEVIESANGVVTLDEYKFLLKTQNVGGSYTFTYNTDHWEYNNEEVTLSDYGLTVVSGTPTNGDTMVIGYTALVVGTLNFPVVDSMKSVGFNAFNSANSASYLSGYTINSSGMITSKANSYVCFVKAVGGTSNGYVIYDGKGTIERVGYSATKPVAGGMITFGPNDVLGTKVSVVKFANDGYVAVAVADKSELCIHPKWSGARDTEFQPYTESIVEMPTKAADNSDLPYIAWDNKLPAIGTTREGFDFEVNKYLHKINRIAFSWASLEAMLDEHPTWVYGTDYVFDASHIWFVIPQQTIDLSDDLDLKFAASDYGTEEWLDAGNKVYTTIAYQPNLVDKLRVDTVTYTDQSDLNKSTDQKAQALLNLGVAPNVDGATEILSTLSLAGTKYKIRDDTKAAGKGIEITADSISAFPYIESVTYDDLSILIATSELVPGQLYRLTDYVCTTAQAETSAANHLFDIILLALDDSHLSEQAWAAHHEGDAYFAESNLEAWQIWYCFNNDTSRFAWADAVNGKGVIYRMIDENRNEAPYDFKNIKFDYYYSLTTKVAYDGYTFGTGSGDDASMTGIYNNVIKEYLDAFGKLALNNNIIRQKAGGTLEAHNNVFGLNSYNNTINATSASDNVLQEQCHNNIFDMMAGCVNNVLDDSCYNNFLAMTDSNLGHGCHSNEIYAESTSLGNNCNDNLIGYASHGVIYASIGNNCDHNNIGGDCQNIYLGSNCSYILFKDSSDYRVNYCKNIYIDSACSYIKLLSTDTAESSSNYLQNVHIHSGINGVSANYKVITIADRALDYTTDVFASGSTEMYV